MKNKRILLMDFLIILIAFILSYLLKNKLNMKISDIMTAIGLLTLGIGLIGFINGRTNIGGIGNPSTIANEYTSRSFIESVKTERDLLDNNKNIKKQNMFLLNFTSLNIAISGLIIILVSIMLQRFSLF